MPTEITHTMQTIPPDAKHSEQSGSTRSLMRHAWMYLHLLGAFVLVKVCTPDMSWSWIVGAASLFVLNFGWGVIAIWLDNRNVDEYREAVLRATLEQSSLQYWRGDRYREEAHLARRIITHDPMLPEEKARHAELWRTNDDEVHNAFMAYQKATIDPLKAMRGAPKTANDPDTVTINSTRIDVEA